VIAWIKIYFEWDWEGAEKAIQNAIQINPSSDMAYHHYTHLLMILGRFEEGLKTAERFRKINPLNRYYIAHEIMDLYMTGQYEQALERGREILASDPGSQAAQVHNADVLDYYRLYDEMLDMPLLPAHDKARALILSGNRSEGMKILNEILADENYINERTVNIACIYMALNDLDKAFEWLEKGSRNREFAFPDIRYNHRFKNVHDDPRWIGIINKLNIAE